MDRIIKLNRRYIEQLAQIDWESEHQGNRERRITFSQMKKEITQRFNEGYELWFGYKKNNELVGYTTFKPFFPGYKHCEMYWLAVKKKYQGQGIGRNLVRFIEKYAKKKGYRKVCLYTGKDMIKTRKFYEKIGYQMTNEFPNYYGYNSGNTTAVLYIKEI